MRLPLSFFFFSFSTKPILTPMILFFYTVSYKQMLLGSKNRNASCISSCFLNLTRDVLMKRLYLHMFGWHLMLDPEHYFRDNKWYAGVRCHVLFLKLALTSWDQESFYTSLPSYFLSHPSHPSTLQVLGRWFLFVKLFQVKPKSSWWGIPERECFQPFRSQMFHCDSNYSPRSE